MVTRREAAVYVLLCLIWSTTWLAIRVGVRYLPPFGFAGIRFLVGAVMLGLFLLAWPSKATSRPIPWGSIATAAVLQFLISYGAVFKGETAVSAGFAAITYASIPLFIALLARLMLGEPLDAGRVSGIVIGFTGIIFLFVDQVLEGPKNLGAEIGLVIGSLAGALSNIFIQRDQGHVSKRLNATLQMAIGCVLLLGTSAMFERGAVYEWNRAAVISLLFLSIFGSAIAFVLYYWLVERHSATKASTIAFVTPLVTVLEEHVFLGERLGWNHLVGGLLVVAGSALVVLAPRVKPRTRG